MSHSRMVAVDCSQVLYGCRRIFPDFDEFVSDWAPLVPTLDQDVVDVGADLEIFPEFPI